MEPSKKAPAMEKFLQKTFNRTTAIKQNFCAACGQPATAFRDTISKREFTISGLCQKCQDIAFQPSKEDV